MSEFNHPSNVAWGGSEPDAYESADGTIFVGAHEKVGGVLKLVIYQLSPAGALLATVDPGLAGQGGLRLQPSGALWAVGYRGYGDNQAIVWQPVPGWKVRPSPSGGALSERYRAALERLCGLRGI